LYLKGNFTRSGFYLGYYLISIFTCPTSFFPFYLSCFLGSMIDDLRFTMDINVQFSNYKIMDRCKRQSTWVKFLTSIFQLKSNINSIFWSKHHIPSIKSHRSSSLSKYFIVIILTIVSCYRWMMTNLFRNKSIICCN